MTFESIDTCDISITNAIKSHYQGYHSQYW